MLIAIGVLALVVVYLANKPMPGDQPAQGSGLPPPDPVPATGTSGVPSPATHPFVGTPLLGTVAGQLNMFTNGGLPTVGNPQPLSAPTVLPRPNVVTSQPLGPPGQSKALLVQQPSSPLATSGNNLRQI